MIHVQIHRNMWFTRLVLLVSALFCSLAVNAQSYQIEQVKGDVYRFVDGRHRSVFLVTKEGIVVTDPMNKKSATWLKAELDKRFKVPVKYVIYSHNHSDHIYGAEVFQSQHTVFVAHTLARQDIVHTKAATVVPSVSFNDQLTLSLGQHTVELRYHGPNDGRGSISMLFKPEKVAYVVDWIVLGRMPWQKLWSYDIQGVINSTREVLALDFDLLVGGHANVGNKVDVARYLSYMEDLYAAVSNGIVAGQSLDELKQSIRLDAYADFDHYEEWLPLNIEGVHERLMEESGMGWRPDIRK